MQRLYASACVGLVLAVAAVAEGRRSAGPGGRAQSAVVPVGSYWVLEHGTLPSSEDCDVRWIEQPLDHFSFGGRGSQATYRERYFFCGGFWNTTGNTKGPIFFYVGNEADVGLYVNATGLMWEHAAHFGALMVFAEHRYYGASQPAADSPTDLAHLSHEQALADYAGLIYELKEEHDCADSAVVAFGGSYGGKLAAWMRFKYPSSVVGAISASAPLLAFRGEAPGWDSGAYYRVITRTAEHYSQACADNVRAAFPALEVAGGTAAGRTSLAKLFGLCKAPNNSSEVAMLKFFIRDAFDSLAMGNYPWPSSYIAGDASHLMPAWPAGLACGHLVDSTLKSDSSRLFAAVNKAVSVLYNVTEDVDCYDLPDYPTPLTPGKPMDGIWDYQWCTEQMPDSFWFSTDGVRDMFWPNPYNATLVATHCKLAWGEAPQTTWIATEYGGRSLGEGHSNVVFSSGGYDGWSSGGVATNITEQSLHAIFIKEGGHHLDLMFSHPDDPASVKTARAFELANVAAWINSYANRTTMESWGDL